MTGQPTTQTDKSGNFTPDNHLEYMDKTFTPPPIEIMEDMVEQYDIPYGYTIISQRDIPTLEDARRNDMMLSYLLPLMKLCGGSKGLGDALLRLSKEVEEADNFEGKWKKNARQRKIGHLAVPSDIRREMAQLYRESYQYGLEGSRFFTRMMYMLDCLMRAVQAEQKHVQKAAHSATTTHQLGGDENQAATS